MNLRRFLLALAYEMRQGTVTPAELERLACALDGINSVYHEELICAAFGVTSKEEKADA